MLWRHHIRAKKNVGAKGRATLARLVSISAPLPSSGDIPRRGENQHSTNMARLSLDGEDSYFPTQPMLSKAQHLMIHQCTPTGTWHVLNDDWLISDERYLISTSRRSSH